jgi:non-canonical purine NTP pyrophosphatase (RdgB/HAM1 family)
MKKILFASTNNAKIGQFQFVADYYGYRVEIVSAYETYPDLKPYSEDFNSCDEIVKQGSLELFQQIKEPLVVEDSIFEVVALDGRPGLTASQYQKAKGRKGILEEMQVMMNREARISSCVGYRTEKEYTLFKTIIDGSISFEERYLQGEPLWIGPTEAVFGGGYNATFVPAMPSKKTLAELTAIEGLQYGYREPNFKAVLEYIQHKKHI